MLVVPLTIAPLVLAIAALVERRLGSSAAGWVVALPVVVVIAIAAVDRDAGPRAAAGLALGAAGHVSAQVVLALLAATVLLRRGLLLGLVAGVAGYVAWSLLVGLLPVAATVLVSVAALAVGPRLLPSVPPRAAPARPWWTTVITCLSGSVLVGVALLASRLTEPHLAGAVTAFPAVSLTLAVVVVCRNGRVAGVQVLDGLVRGLPCYLAFCLAAGVAAPRAGSLAVPLGLLAALATAFVAWRGVTVLRPQRAAPLAEVS